METECNGFCAQGPVLKVSPEGTLYQKLKEEDIPSCGRAFYQRAACEKTLSQACRSC